MRFFVLGRFTAPRWTVFKGISGASQNKARFCESADGTCGNIFAFPSKRWEACKRIAQAPKSNASSSWGLHSYATVVGSGSSLRYLNVATTAPGLSTLATTRSLPLHCAQVSASQSPVAQERTSPAYAPGFSWTLLNAVKRVVRR